MSIHKHLGLRTGTRRGALRRDGPSTVFDPLKSLQFDKVFGRRLVCTRHQLRCSMTTGGWPWGTTVWTVLVICLQKKQGSCLRFSWKGCSVLKRTCIIYVLVKDCHLHTHTQIVLNEVKSVDHMDRIPPATTHHSPPADPDPKHPDNQKHWHRAIEV